MTQLIVAFKFYECA